MRTEINPNSKKSRMEKVLYSIEEKSQYLTDRMDEVTGISFGLKEEDINDLKAMFNPTTVLELANTIPYFLRFLGYDTGTDL